ncbi:MAG: ATP-binding protein [Terracidiphilus sp.]|jgi:two-component system sensor histidine kinase FlrB
MLPYSHVVPINTAVNGSLHNSVLLADAFSEFIAASSQLEASYRDLQQEVAHLGVELAERNTALTRSLADNDRIRAALQQIIDSMPCGVLVLDSDETIVTINPEGRRLLDLGNVRVGSLRELSAVSQVDFASLVAGSDLEIDSEACISYAGGKRWVAIGNRRLSCEPAGQELEDQTPRLKSIWILRDITASKNTERDREAARNAMALAEVSTILAHEIRNPLACMELFAGLIAEDRGDDAPWVSPLRAGIRQLSGTVNNVLNIHCGGNLHLGPVDLVDAMRSGVEFVRPIADQAGVHLSFHSGEDKLMVMGNENLLRQIILNLACNAIRHTPAGGEIEVSTQETSRNGNRSGLVEVTDTGCGMEPQILDRIFEAGFSGSGDTPGLGLAVCKRLMISHGGEIRVSSQVNQGTTFRLEFPTL